MICREKENISLSPSGTRNGSSRARGAGRKLSAPSGRTPPMAGSCLWNIKDAPLLGIFVKSHLEEHPSCVPLCLPAWRTEVLLPDVFRFGERTCANLKKNPASFLSAPFRHTLFSGEYDALEGCASSCLLGAITDSLSERHEAPYHVSEEFADRAFFRVMNELAEGASKRKG